MLIALDEIEQEEHAAAMAEHQKVLDALRAGRNRSTNPALDAARQQFNREHGIAAEPTPNGELTPEQIEAMSPDERFRFVMGGG